MNLRIGRGPVDQTRNITTLVDGDREVGAVGQRQDAEILVAAMRVAQSAAPWGCGRIPSTVFWDAVGEFERVCMERCGCEASNTDPWFYHAPDCAGVRAIEGKQGRDGSE